MPKVWNKRDKNVPKDAVYVGRPSTWGNPFTHLKSNVAGTVQVVTHQEAIDNYAKWIKALSPGSMQILKDTLRGKDLVCWCAPRPCHADILLKVANESQ